MQSTELPKAKGGTKMTTKEYRKSQLKNITAGNSIYKSCVKFMSPNGETNFFDITEPELNKIKKILLKRGRL